MKCGCCGFFRSDLIIFLSRIFSWLSVPFFLNIFVALPGNRLFDSPGVIVAHFIIARQFLIGYQATIHPVVLIREIWPYCVVGEWEGRMEVLHFLRVRLVKSLSETLSHFRRRTSCAGTEPPMTFLYLI